VIVTAWLIVKTLPVTAVTKCSILRVLDVRVFYFIPVQRQ